MVHAVPPCTTFRADAATSVWIVRRVRSSLLAWSCALIALIATACQDSEHDPPGYDGILTLPSRDAEADPTEARPDAGDRATRVDAGDRVERADAAPPTPSSGGGIGQPCEMDDECAAGLRCHEDFAGYVSHHQCTRDCQAGSDCTDIAAGTMCIGAEVCTLRCRTDADCPAKTHCIDAGWCKREGAGSGVPTCTGTPSSCFGRPSEYCLIGLGCSYQSADCTGFSSSCSAQFSSVTCYGVQGCTWLPSSGFCSGSARSCSLLLSSSCSTQPGCSWKAESCSGVPTSCARLTASACTLQPGCRLQTN
jgi:hypothetical protein